MNSKNMAETLVNLGAELATLQRKKNIMWGEITAYEKIVHAMDEQAFLIHCQETLSEHDLQETEQGNPQFVGNKRRAILFSAVEKKIRAVEEKIGFLQAIIDMLAQYDRTPITMPLEHGYSIRKTFEGRE